MEHSAFLVLENGTVFEGYGFGATGEITGEVVFTTAMTGYLETLTDPSYYGQIVLQTFPLIGNYGVIPEDFESDSPYLKGYIVSEWCQAPSNFRMEGSVDAFLKQQNIVGLYGIDTRALTKMIRDKGTLNGRITTDPETAKQQLQDIRAFKVKDAILHASLGKRVIYEPDIERFHVVLWDFGAKMNLIRELRNRGCRVTRVPADTTAKEIRALSPDGLLLSNGPGDPTANPEIIDQVKDICQDKLPTFGICMGHQLLAIAQGASSSKLPFGHRGENQPAKDTKTGRVYITSQNHGYAINSESLPPTARQSFVNANDGTNEGIDYQNMPAFSVQFHPEGAGGPQDTVFLFNRFISMMEGN